MSALILIVEDEKNIVDILNFNLRREGYDTLEAFDGETGLQLALEKNPDLILLDLMLPRLDGYEVCKRIREVDSSIPILILTAREDEDDKVKGLEMGADDYITKPFSVRELLARVKTNIRRSAVVTEPADNDAEVLRFGPLSIDTAGYAAFKNDEPLDLTAREFELLKFLAAHAGTVFSRETLMEQVWNYEYAGDARTVDVTIRRLREKVEDTPAHPIYILTRRGVGYLFAGQ